MSQSFYYASIPSPLGPLTLFEDNGAIVVLEFGKVPEGSKKTPLLKEAEKQLKAYFDGKLQTFDLPLSPDGTPFQKKVWNAMRKIKYGTVWTYGDMARKVKSAPRAVGGACGKNPIPIIIPCHRVVGAKMNLTGYSGGDGLETKETLLILEGVLAPDPV